MSSKVATIVEPFVRRGLFASPEQAVAEMARDYVLRQIEHYQATIQQLQSRSGMTYEQFEVYLQARSSELQEHPDSKLNTGMRRKRKTRLIGKSPARCCKTGWGYRLNLHEYSGRLAEPDHHYVRSLV